MDFATYKMLDEMHGMLAYLVQKVQESEKKGDTDVVQEEARDKR